MSELKPFSNLPRYANIRFQLGPLIQLSLGISSRLCAVGWYQLESPEGRTYFWNQKRVSVAGLLHCGVNIYLSQNLYTDHFIFREDVLPEDTEETKPENNQSVITLQAMADELRGRFPEQQDTSEHSDLVIELLESGRWVYYFADTARKTVFWVDEIPVKDLLADSFRYVQSGTHLGLASLILANCGLNVGFRFAARD